MSPHAPPARRGAASAPIGVTMVAAVTLAIMMAAGASVHGTARAGSVAREAAVPPLPETAVPRQGPVGFAGMTLIIRAGRLAVAEVAPGSPAAQAGVLPGDVILTVDGVALVDLEAVSPARALDLFRRAGGDEIRMTLGRGGATLRLGLSRDSRDPGPSPDPIPLLPGRPAPDIEGRDLKGAAFSLKDLRGRLVLIDFWASTCPPCRNTPIPLARIAGQHAGVLEIVGVSLDEDPRSFEAFVYNHLLPGHQIRDGGGWFGPIARRYEIASTGIPYFVLLDRDGRIAAMGSTLDAIEERIALLAGGAR